MKTNIKSAFVFAVSTAVAATALCGPLVVAPPPPPPPLAFPLPLVAVPVTTLPNSLGTLIKLPDLKPDLQCTLCNIRSGPTVQETDEGKKHAREQRLQEARNKLEKADAALNEGDLRNAVIFINSFLALSSDAGDKWNDARTQATERLWASYAQLAQQAIQLAQVNEAFEWAMKLEQSERSRGCMLLAYLYGAIGFTPMQAGALRCAAGFPEAQATLETLDQSGLSEFTWVSGSGSYTWPIRDGTLIRSHIHDSQPWAPRPAAFVWYAKRLYILYGTTQPEFSWLTEVSNTTPRIVRLFGQRKLDDAALWDEVRNAAQLAEQLDEGEETLHTESEAGEKLFRTMLESDPDNIAVRTTLAEIRAQHNNADGVRALLAPLVNKYPAWGLATRGRLLSQIAAQAPTSSAHAQMLELARDDLERATFAVQDTSTVSWLTRGTHWLRIQWNLVLAYLQHMLGADEAARNSEDRARSVENNPAPLVTRLKVEWEELERAVDSSQRTQAFARVTAVIAQLNAVAPKCPETDEYRIRVMLGLDLYGPAATMLYAHAADSSYAAGALRYLNAIESVDFEQIGVYSLPNNPIAHAYSNRSETAPDSMLQYHMAEVVVTNNAGVPFGYVYARQRLMPGGPFEYTLDFHYPGGQVTIARLGNEEVPEREVINFLISSIDPELQQ